MRLGAIVGEVQQSIHTFLGDAVISLHLHPTDDLAARVDPTRHPAAEAYEVRSRLRAHGAGDQNTTRWLRSISGPRVISDPTSTSTSTSRVRSRLPA